MALLILSHITYSDDVEKKPDKCIDKICKDQSCYATDLTFIDTDRSKYRKANWKEGEDNAGYYRQLTPEQNLIEVTDQVLKDPNVSEKDKKVIKKYNKRIFVFLYPSDNLLIPGFISFVPDTEKSDLIMLLRGGNNMLGIYHPANYISWGSNTILGTLYRGNIGKGKDEFGGDDVNDVLNLVKYIDNLEKRLDIKFTSKKKYLIGNSRGGMMMFLALTRYPELQKFFDKAISNSGSVNPEILGSEIPRRYKGFKKEFGMSEENKEQWFRARAAKYHIDKIDKNFPILILQATKDIRVGLRQGVELYNLMKEAGHNITYWEVKDASHCMMNCSDRPEIFDDWLNMK